MKRKSTLFLILSGLMACVLGFLFRGINKIENSSLTQIEKIYVGMPETDVKILMGVPYQIVAATNSTNCYWKGYTYKNRLISYSLLIYPMPPDMVVYIYIDNRKAVEDVFVGKS